MKKILFIMPLMVVSLLASCGNNNPRTTDEYTVTEQEMKDALAMKGVEYLQTVTTVPKSSYIEKLEFAPMSHRYILENDSSYYEQLIFKDGEEDYSEYIRTSKEGNYEPTSYSGDFETIADYKDTIFLTFLEEVDYNNFYYIDTNKEYLVYVNKESEVLGVFLIQFYNKKIVNYHVIMSAKSKFIDATLSFSYDKKEPPSPTI